jgi:predicted phage terminase large subunit-like protein
LADFFGRNVRNLVCEPIHRAIFSNFRLANDSASIYRFSTTAGGSYYAVGRGGAINGRGANLLILDDLIKNAEEARSELIRQGLFEWYAAVARTRLQPNGAIILISTRWHEDELAGRLLRQQGGEEWHVVRMPAIAEADETFRLAGEALWPGKYPLDTLEQIRREIGSEFFFRLFQQHPGAAEGTIFKRRYWQFYREPPVFRRIVQSWDTAFKTGAENDFSACTTWGVANHGCFLLGFWRGKVEFPELKRTMNRLADEWRPAQILVEDRASGQSLIQELKYASALPIIPIKANKDKRSRAEAIAGMIETGKVCLPESAPWLNDYVDEHAAFPYGLHDDAVDSTVQALSYIRYEPIQDVQFTTVYL